ncbi:hypothetical protein CCP3SC1AL1_1790002 [Gammaproteobacteria bacterium]
MSAVTRSFVGNIKLEGSQIIDDTSSNSFTIRKDNAGTTIFNVDTSTDVISITGNITVSGNIDGRDVSVSGSSLSNLADGIGNLTVDEVNQLENINTNTISTTQWGYISASDQSVATGSNVIFNSAIIDSTGTEAFLVRKDLDAGDIFTVDTTNTIVKVGPGSAIASTGQLSLYGTVSSASLGPHFTATTTSDIYPVFQIVNFAHNDIRINFDMYFDGSARSSTSGSNYRIIKTSNELRFQYASGIAAGSVVTPTTGFFMNTSGVVTFEGGAIIDTTSTEAFLIRKNGDTGDVFTIDTQNDIVTSGPDILMKYQGDGVSAITFVRNDGNTTDINLTLTGTGTASVIRVSNNTADNGRIDFSNGTIAYASFGVNGSTLQSILTIDNSNTEALLVRKNADAGDVFTVDTTNGIVKIGPGSAIANTSRFSLYGTDSSAILGPHLSATTTEDIYTTSQIVNYTHNNIQIHFDSYNIDGINTSSHSGSNYRILKNANLFRIQYASGITVGSTFTYVTGIQLNTSGVVSLESCIIDKTSTEAFLIRKNADAGDVFTVNTSTDVVTVAGSITVSGSVDGRDISVDGATLDNLNTTIGLGALTTAEVDQLENINSNTISSTQWGYLTSSNQTTDTASDVQHNTIIADATSATALDVRKNAVGTTVFNVDTSSDIVTVDAIQIIDVTNAEALLVRKNGDTGDIFTVDTTNSIITVNNTLNFTNSGTPLLNMRVSGLAFPAFTTRSNGTKVVLYDTLGAAAVDYAIGVATDTFWSSVATTAKSFRWYAGTTPVGELTGAGLFTVTGNVVSFGSISDISYKKNIVDIEPSKAMYLVDLLNPVTYTWKDTIPYESNRNKDDSGFIAQEVMKVLPHAVSEYTELSSGEVKKMLRHERILPYLTAAIQNIYNQVEECKKLVMV